MTEYEKRDLISREEAMKVILRAKDRSEAIRMLTKIPGAEPLTDPEERIFLAAIERERKVCEEVDRKYSTGDPNEQRLEETCRSIKRKVRSALWS